jgi:hypothetical protein
MAAPLARYRFIIGGIANASAGASTSSLNQSVNLVTMCAGATASGTLSKVGVALTANRADALATASLASLSKQAKQLTCARANALAYAGTLAAGKRSPLVVAIANAGASSNTATLDKIGAPKQMACTIANAVATSNLSALQQIHRPSLVLANAVATTNASTTRRQQISALNANAVAASRSTLRKQSTYPTLERADASAGMDAAFLNKRVKQITFLSANANATSSVDLWRRSTATCTIASANATSNATTSRRLPITLLVANAGSVAVPVVVMSYYDIVFHATLVHGYWQAHLGPSTYSMELQPRNWHLTKPQIAEYDVESADDSWKIGKVKVT